MPECALSYCNKIKLKVAADEGSKSSKMVLKCLDKFDNYIIVGLIGNNIVNIAASSLVTTFTIDLFGNVAVGIASGILTIVILLFGEITPKTGAMINAEKIALLYSGIIKFLMFILEL